jgi:hypothetical protein
MRKNRWIIGAIAVGLAVTAGLRCGSDTGMEPEVDESGLVPTRATVEVSSSRLFEAAFGGEYPEVSWWVDGIPGGSVEAGMITPEGVYIAPPQVTETGSVTVTAKAVGDTLRQASADVTLVRNSGTAYIEVDPGRSTVALFDSLVFGYTASGCPPTDPDWSIQLISGASVDIGWIDASGTYFPPRFPSGDFELLITAKSNDCEDKTGIARVAVKVPEHFYVEFEDFTETNGPDIDRDVSCGGGLGITGLDEPGEWITVPVEIPAGGRYTAYLRYAAGFTDRMDVTVTFEDGPYGTPQAAFVLDQGNGVGT